MIDETLKDAVSRMLKSVDALARDLQAIRTGRASTSLVEHVTVDYHGTPMPLNQLATIAVPEARLITIQPWDKGVVTAIEKAIQRSDLGLNPANDGVVIRLPIPPLTQERRKEMAKMVRKRVEEAKIAIRNVRRDGVEAVRGLEKDKQISQDDQRRAQDRIQTLTDQYITRVDKLGEQKEAELMEV